MSDAYISSSTSGIVEMDGLQRTFSNIYNMTSEFHFVEQFFQNYVTLLAESGKTSLL